MAMHAPALCFLTLRSSLSLKACHILIFQFLTTTNTIPSLLVNQDPITCCGPGS
ncbi:hypothetical protein PF005_g18927 [Phytophthora fragariae]|uniref:Uncharacterized protein n=1 Tax=Phytophthora fragariae TaxID=53985 RepID=A0A6A4CTW9_9STRA|nr:hypothetical protein PF003_g35968 [Phytophthora fragariae]KAE8930019.1 hypothetical protein PF009_g19884 [Phytophthora fragariae]KAE8990714.1 hypothetical protein PF011_g18239 [Phytophthora fragariae]KAE9089958.1 hypothetical protein PF007_g19414 [Phytophthora fragariae]KAE9090263.1 hypothetical protein PF010_g18659 [Phytophthora fragariae]